VVEGETEAAAAAPLKPDALVHTVRYRWVVLAVGTGAQASFSAVAIGLPALAPALRSRYDLSLGEIGVVLGAVGIGMLVTLLPWGLAADRLGERWVIAIGLAGAAVALAATGWAGSYGSLTGLLIVAGLLGASVNAASGRAVMAWFGVEERGLALGIRQTSVPIGGACAAAALPWLADAGGTKLAFVVLGAACLAGALAAALWMREAAHAPVLATTVTAPFRDPAMWLISGCSSAYVTGQIAIVGFVVLFLHEHRGLAPGAAAAVLAVTHVLGGVARIVVGRWSDHVRARVRPLRVLGLAIAVGMAVAAAAVDAPLPLLVPAVVAAGVLGLSWNGLAFTAAAETAGVARSGAALGFQQTVLGVAVAVVPIAFAAIVNASSWRVGFALAALGPLAGSAALSRLREPQTEVAES
jgi:sugar phosphate permease